MEKLTLDPKDFDLTQKYSLFTVLYIIPKDFETLVIKAWTVVGYVLNSSSDKRCFQTYLTSYPIHVHVMKNEHAKLEDFNPQFYFISTDRNEVVRLKREFIRSKLEEYTNKIV